MGVKPLVWTLCGLAMALLIAESAARVLHDPEPLRRVYDPFAYRIPAPGLRESFQSRQGERVEFELNELGMRGPSIAAPVAEGTFTVVFLGGSTTENYAYNDADTFPVIVGRGVAERIGRPVRVFNAGMSASTTSTDLARLQHQVLDLRPDLIVLMEGINDLLGGFHRAYRPDGRHLERPQAAGNEPPSYLYDWFRQRTRPLLRRPAREPDVRMTDFEGFAARRVFERNLRSMSAIARAQEIDALFLTMGTMYSEHPSPGDSGRFAMIAALGDAARFHPDIPSLAVGMRAFNAVVLALPQGGHTHVLDLAARLPQSWDIFYDDCHFTKAGNQLVAATISPAIETILRKRITGG